MQKTLTSNLASSLKASAGADGNQLPPRKRSEELLGGAREIVIEHRGIEYRLRLTSQDKLILTK